MFASGGRDDVIDGLRAVALARGVSTGEFDAALAEGRLDLLLIDRLLLPSGAARTGEEVSRSSGTPIEEADRLWRALGFPEAGDEPLFNDADVEALRTIRGLSVLGLSSVEHAVQVTRVLGQSMARLADVLIASADEAAEVQGRPEWACETEDDALLLAQAIALSSEVALPNLERLILYAWRRHLQAAARRRATMARSGSVEGSLVNHLAVGFADMVGFTALSSQLSAGSLARLVDRFEEVAHTTVVDGGGRPVKMIGDEVMFVATDPAAAVGIGLSLVDAYADDELLSDVRVGVAAGPVLVREGDFFGSVVNRAHRIVSIADAGTVLCGDEVHSEVVAGPTGLDWRPLKPRELKDLGRVRLWSVRRVGQVPSAERRSGVRSRRLSEPAQAARILPHGSAS